MIPPAASRSHLPQANCLIFLEEGGIEAVIPAVLPQRPPPSEVRACLLDACRHACLPAYELAACPLACLPIGMHTPSLRECRSLAALHWAGSAVGCSLC